MNSEELIQTLKTYKKCSSKHLASLINYAHRCLNEDNACIIHAFLLNLQRQKLNISPLYIRPITIYMNFLKSKLKFINSDLKVNEIELQCSKKSDDTKYSLVNEITASIQQVLIKSSYKELENMINSYFGERKLRKFEFLDCIIFKIERIKKVEDKVKGYYLLCKIIEFDFKNENKKEELSDKIEDGLVENNVKHVMEYFTRYKIDCSLFFYILYLTNAKLYESFHDLIFSETHKRLDLLKSLPYINLAGKELNEPLIRYLIENRPIHKQTIVEYLIGNRDMLFNIIKDYYSFFSIDHLNLSFEEHLLLCETIDENVFFLFEYLKFFVENDSNIVNKFVKMLITKDELYLKSFFETFYTSKIEIYEVIVLSFLKQKKIGEELCTFFIKYFVDKIKIKHPNKEHNVEFEGFSEKFARDVFFALIYYIDKDTLIMNLETYLGDEAALREFLKVLSPHEIYYNIHYYSDIKKSLTISQIISSKKEVFDEQVSLSVISSMEESDLPPLFMRTVLVSLSNFPNIKNFVVDLMKRLVRIEIWNMKRLYTGFLRCLSVLGNSCVEIVMMMPEERMKSILVKNGKILDLCEKYIKNHGGLKGKYAYLFKNAVYSQLKKKKEESKEKEKL